MKIIKTDPAISWDSLTTSYYNDRKTYITIKIKKTAIENEYTFRFLGDADYWSNSQNSSELFIAYAFDKNKRGGCQARGDFSWYHNWGLKKKFTNVFEEEFVSKIDKELGMKHTDKK